MRKVGKEQSDLKEMDGTMVRRAKESIDRCQPRDFPIQFATTR